MRNWLASAMRKPPPSSPKSKLSPHRRLSSLSSSASSCCAGAQHRLTGILLVLVAVLAGLHLLVDVAEKRASLASSPPLTTSHPSSTSRLALLTPSPLHTSCLVHPDVAQLLSDAIAGVPPIPHIVHFIIGTVHSSSADPPTFSAAPPFGLPQYLAIKAAHDVLSASTVYCHVVEAPSGPWWAAALSLCGHVIPARSVTHIFGRPVLHRQHKADVLRLEALLNYGGVAVDLDVLVMSDWDEPAWRARWMSGDLLLAQAQMEGRPHPDRLDIGVIAARRQSLFLKEWYAALRMFDGGAVVESEGKDGARVWADDMESFGALMAQRMASTRPHLVTLAPPDLFGRPCAADAAGWTRVYTRTPGESAEMAALHTWQGERERRRERSTGEVEGVEPPDVPRIDTVEDVCKLAQTSLYGAALKRALLAGTGHTYSCRG